MQNLQNAHPASGKAIDPSAFTCPHCGTPVHLLHGAPKGVRRGSFSPNVRRRVGGVLSALRGSLLWFALVFITMGLLAAVTGQGTLPALFGAGLLAVYAITGLLTGT